MYKDQPGAICRHVYKKMDPIDPLEEVTYAFSDNTGNWCIGLTKSEANAKFDKSIFTHKTQLEDIDQTLKELEKNLKIISVRALSYVSDYVDKVIERLS
jgi:hypothetical protein